MLSGRADHTIRNGADRRLWPSLSTMETIMNTDAATAASMLDGLRVEYRVRPVTRYQVTRYHETEGGRTGGTEQKGEYDNPEVAYEVGYALAKEEHRRLGYPLGDERIQYPEHPGLKSSLAGGTITATAKTDYNKTVSTRSDLLQG